jgi:hypothetical protein
MPILEKPVSPYDIAAEQGAVDYVEMMQRRAAYRLFDTLRENPSSNLVTRCTRELLSARPVSFSRDEPPLPTAPAAPQFTGNVVPFPKRKFPALAKS